ncbi:MAG: ArgR family transcriptional regulator [Dysgonamonadaceae bacterium]|jgi:transcriptional regulator of arginine metabolism|nr:ArgR family transcriptional regulator [Dysgonamonadaceae bacterium]
MRTQKEKRLSKIMELVREHSLSNQNELLVLLRAEGFDVTQATLSRDIRQLKIVKTPDLNGSYVYTTSRGYIYNSKLPDIEEDFNIQGFLSLNFSDNLAVIKTRSGYAMGIASDIDSQISYAILGTIAGDDTILLIPREGFDRMKIINALKELNIHKNE